MTRSVFSYWIQLPQVWLAQGCSWLSCIHVVNEPVRGVLQASFIYSRWGNSDTTAARRGQAEAGAVGRERKSEEGR